MSISTSADDKIFLNGVDALTGGHLTPPVGPEALVDLARTEFRQTPKSDQARIRALSERTSQPHLGFDTKDLEDLTEARWGVIFFADEAEAVKQALEPLIRRRADQFGFRPPVFEYQPSWTAADFLARNGVAPAFGEVEKVPYYLLIVGDPSRVPFRFQYELGTEYAVGRLCFGNVDGYRAYVEGLIDYETSTSAPTRRDAVFWATANENDRATELSSRLLVQPLYEDLNPILGFRKQILLGPEATKANLTDVLTRPMPPAFLFTASHGLGFRQPDPQQPALQGALVTQEWQPDTAITSERIFGGPDLSASHNVRGLVHFAFACFGAGTPSQDDFAHSRNKVAPIIADQPFVASLPQQLLSRGALAFIGHVERAWGFSFIGPTGAPQLTGFERAIRRLLRGIPVGHALRDQHDRALQLSHSLLEDLNELDYGKVISPETIAEKWMERNDARAYVLIGDPGARLRVKDMQ